MIDFCEGCSDGPPVTTKAARGGSSPVAVHVGMRVFYKLKHEHLPRLIDNFPRKNWHNQYCCFFVWLTLHHNYVCFEFRRREKVVQCW